MPDARPDPNQGPLQKHVASSTAAPKSLVLVLAMGLMLGLMSGCNRDQPSHADDPPKPSGMPPAAESQPTTSSSGSAPQPTSTAAAVSRLAGIWQGTYDAQKGSVFLPPKVNDKVRQKDDGKLASGPGKVTLTISDSGEVSGRATGALGNATLVGKVDNEMMRASVLPDDPHDPHAMTGTLVGKLKDDVLVALLRVAGPDAVLVRESEVNLQKK